MLSFKHYLSCCLIFFTTQALCSNQPPAPAASHYVGSNKCSSCHQQQFNAWQGSDHQQSMNHADVDSVRGDFNTSVVFNGKTNRFFIKKQQYWVNIAGPDGQFHDYQIKYTFGHFPLQQYMVEFADGRVQLIPFAWDSRQKKAGGQRWFRLHDNATRNHQEFYWTNTGQNWNYMCADCHSTNVKKNYDLKSNSYQTSFSEINVGCEACHGPASEHLKWTKNTPPLPLAGFATNLKKQVNNWQLPKNKTTLLPQKIESTQQTLVCAQCHARRTQISSNDHLTSNQYGDRYLLNLINPAHYYPDGRVYDEDFVYGSFLQSKMHKNGVVCTNCHDPHSGKLTLPTKTLCLQCHQASTYASSDHHRHQENSSGAQCVNCHMPQTTYMQVDARREHSWHIPRPQLSKAIGSPDTCLSCHQDKDSDWSSKQTAKWYAKPSKSTPNHFGLVFAAIDQGYTDAATELSRLAQNKNNAPIIRASALQRMSRLTDPNSLIALTRAVKNLDANIRLAAATGASNLKQAQRWRILSPLLTDKVLAVRSEAANALIPLWQSLSSDQQQRLQPALNDYLAVQKFNVDRGFAHSNTGNVYAYQGKYQLAQQSYFESVRIEPHFAQAYVNLAELYRRWSQNTQAVNILRQGIAANPEDNNLTYSLGLAYIRTKQYQKASQSFKQSITLSPNNVNYRYIYSLSLESLSPDKAMIAMRETYTLSANPQHLYALCEMQIRHDAARAPLCLSQLATVAPAAAVAQLQQQLDNK